uniref:Uncharacterized protein n=1 Tax=Arundo donax TaxID=35708 RepID=A0A0A8ZIJ1_ARUDO
MKCVLLAQRTTIERLHCKLECMLQRSVSNKLIVVFY